MTEARLKYLCLLLHRNQRLTEGKKWQIHHSPQVVESESRIKMTKKEGLRIESVWKRCVLRQCNFVGISTVPLKYFIKTPVGQSHRQTQRWSRKTAGFQLSSNVLPSVPQILHTLFPLNPLNTLPSAYLPFRTEQRKKTNPLFKEMTIISSLPLGDKLLAGGTSSISETQCLFVSVVKKQDAVDMSHWIHFYALCAHLSVKLQSHSFLFFFVSATIQLRFCMIRKVQTQF